MIFRSTYSKPILLVGNGVRTADAVDMVHEFARKTNIPVLTTLNGVDLAQDDMHIGFIGTHGNRVANMILNGTKRSKATAATRLLPAPLASWSLSAPRPRASMWSCSTAAVTCTMVVLLSWPKAPVRAA